MSLDLLLNRTLVSVVQSKWIFRDKETDDDIITFNFEDGSESYCVEGDCCSTSWIEHLTIPDNVQGSKVISVEELTIGEQQEINNYEYLQVYETRIRTNRGDIVLEYRNSSNGYYGGYLRHLEKSK